VAVYDRDIDGSNDVLRLYINNDPTSFSGAPVATSPTGTTGLNQFSNTDNSGIGMPNNTYADTATAVPFEGKLAAVRLYTRVLSVAEIEANFDTMAHPITAIDDVPPSSPGPVVTTSTLGATVTLNADGSVDYDASSLGSDIAKGVVDQDYFTFVLGDGEGGAISNSVTVNVTGVDTGGAEFLAVDDLVPIGQDAAATAFDPLINDLGASNATIQTLQTHETSFDEAWAISTNGAVVGADAVFTNAMGHGWRFLWNAPSAWTGTNTAGNATNGFLGTEADYIPLKWSGANWTGDGDDNNAGNGDISKYLRIQSHGGHTGRGSTQAEGVSNNIERCAIVAYTVPTNGSYAIVNSGVYLDVAAGHIQIHVYVNDTLRSTITVPDVATRTFDTTLGALNEGDDIYVAASPATSAANDGFRWDFDIVMLPSAESDPLDTVGAFTTDGTNITYDPNGQFTMLAVGESVFETVTYTIVDGADSSTADFTVEVTGVNDAPVNLDDSYSTDEDSTRSGELLDNDTDPDTGETLTLTVAEVQGATGNVGVSTPTDNGGSVTVQADGSFVYDPGSAFQGLPWDGADSDSFTYLIEDIHGLDATNAAAVTISISGNEDGVDARDDFFSTDVEGGFSGNLLVDNGAGPDSSTDTGEDIAILSIDTTGLVGSLTSGPKVPQVIGTCGNASVTHEAQTVTHGLTLTDPVVIAGPPSYNEAQHCVARVFNVTPTTFDIQIYEQPETGAAHDSDGNVHTNENVHWLVLETGQYELPNGLLMEVGKVDTTAIQHDGAGGASWETVTLATSFPTIPAVLNTIQTLNGSPEENVERMGTRMRNVASNSFQVAMEDYEGDTGARTNAETIAWVAIEPGNGTWGNGPFEARTTGLTYEEGFKALNFVRTYGSGRRFVASMTTIEGADPAQLRRKGVTSTSVDLSVIEDTVGEPEVAHATESVAYIVIDDEGGNLEAFDQSGNQGDFTYDPGGAANWRGQMGPASFTYTLTDGRGNTDTATVTIDVSFGTLFIVR